MAKSKEKPASKRGRKKGEQLHIDGMAPAKNAKVHPIALNYVRIRDHRMEMTKEEVELKGRLLAVMQAEGLTEYAFDDISVEVKHSDDVKVKKAGKSDDAE